MSKRNTVKTTKPITQNPKPAVQADPNAPKVYSYTRFSSDEQKHGDSNRRQDDKAEQWAKRKGIPLDETLKDEGLSGYHGVNRTRGALGRFLQRIEAGDVPPGSVLLVENIDRLSREDFVQAFETVSRIITAGVMLVTLEPYTEYTRESIKGGLIWQLVGQMQRAYEESERKSRMIRASRDQARKKAREERRVMTAMCPAWLTPKPDRTGYEVNKPAAKTIRMIFDWCLQGVSTRKIEAKLNAQAPWMPPPREKAKRDAGLPGSGWWGTYVMRLLRNRAVIGEYQPYVQPNGRGGPRIPEGEPIPDYYPQIIPKDLFFAVQERLSGNRTTGGKTGKARNVLTHMVKCAYCGGPMRYTNKGQRSEYLVCDQGARGVACKSSHRIRYDEVVNVLLENCQALRPEDVLPQPDEQTQLCHALRAKLSGMAGELADAERKLANLTDRVADAPTKAIAERVYAQMAMIEERKKELEQQRHETERELRDAETGLKQFTAWKQNVASLKNALAEEGPELRLRLRSHLRDCIDRVDVYAVGYPAAEDAKAVPVRARAGKGKRSEATLETADGIVAAAWDTVGEALPLHRDPALAEHFRAFVADLLARRMSKEGRFIRVHYKTGAMIDIVPPGSLASGSSVTGGKWVSVEPDIGKMWADYQRANAKRQKG